MSNVKNERKLTVDEGFLLEKISYMAIEGSSLTLLGLVKYDSEADCFMLTNLSHCMAGGVGEVYRVINEKIL